MVAVELEDTYPSTTLVMLDNLNYIEFEHYDIINQKISIEFSFERLLSCKFFNRRSILLN
jgi:hypothetical protein